MKSTLQNCCKYNKWVLLHVLQDSMLNLLSPHKSTAVGSCWKTLGELIALVRFMLMLCLCVQQQSSLATSCGQRLNFDGYWYLIIFNNLEILLYTKCFFGMNPTEISRCHLRFLFDQFSEFLANKGSAI